MTYYALVTEVLVSLFISYIDIHVYCNILPINTICNSLLLSSSSLYSGTFTNGHSKGHTACPPNNGQQSGFDPGQFEAPYWPLLMLFTMFFAATAI